MTTKEKIIEIIGCGMEPERAECKADEILDVVKDEKLDLILAKMKEIETTLEVLSQPAAVIAVSSDGNFSPLVTYECGTCGESVPFGQNHTCP